jgi:uncharacterized protein (UPF0332 family)
MRITHNFNWAEYIDFSEKLFSNSTSIGCSNETICRVVCSRAYYGIFKLIEDFCEENAISLLDRDRAGNYLGSHKKIKIYLNTQNTTLKRLISRLYTTRIKADYNKNARVTDRLAEQSINNAKQAKDLFGRDKENWI